VENFLSLVCWAGLFCVAGDQNPKARTMTASEAQKHIGETATVCGKVAGTRISKYGVAGHGRPIILALDKPEPDSAFLILTLPENAKSPHPDAVYVGKQVCATGKIVKVQDVPQIIASKPSQITIQSDAKK
jgi:hypothetical protein